MTKTVVLTGVGRDRVGIVAELTQLLYQLGCNLLDSSMTLLRGEFALILMVELPASAQLADLEADLRKIETQLGMTVHVRELGADELLEMDNQRNSFIVSVYGADKTGIVAKVTRALADAGVSITDVQTKSTGVAPKIFVMILEVTAAPDITVSAIEDLLARIAAELTVDITVQPLDVVEL